MRRIVLVCFVCVVALLFSTPAYAAGGSYSIDELSTEITVETDATAHIVERQTVTFADANEGMVWYLHVPEDGESVRISSVKVAPADDGGTLLGDWTRLQMVDSSPIKQGRNPGDSAILALRRPSIQPWYSYNIGDGMMRCYFPLSTGANRKETSNTPSNGQPNGESAEPSDEQQGETSDIETPSPPSSSANNADSSESETYHTFVIETDYVIRHRVRVYRDVAELYWRYVNDSLPSDSKDVNLLIKLPVPADTDSSTVVEQIHAWGHGPNEGTFSIGEDGTVNYHIDHIASGNYAEAHVIFPADWMTNMDANAPNYFSSIRSVDAIAEEAEWVDKSQREATWDNNVRVLFLVLAIVIILVGLVCVLRFGRSPRSRRALIRVATTLAIVALGENLFFREPLTTLMLFALAGVVLAVALMLPQVEEMEEDFEEPSQLANDETE